MIYHRLLVAFAVNLVLTASVQAEKLQDSSLFGVWGSGAAIASGCSTAAFPDEALDTLAKIDGNGIEFTESWCRFASIKRDPDARTYLTTLNCGGEGQKWTATEVWSVAEIAGERYLFIAVLAPKLGSDIYRRCK